MSGVGAMVRWTAPRKTKSGKVRKDGSVHTYVGEVESISDVELAQVISRSADAAADLLKEWAERLRSLKGQS